ncbi:MAG: glycoside hydrolase family 30 protein [Kiritimatiellae bacterium]|nr:glycoside hydrolase family 30 protein [Kiritimatiellia bacterium]
MGKSFFAGLLGCIVLSGAAAAAPAARLWETSKDLHPTMTRLADPVLSPITAKEREGMFKDDRVTVDEGARFQKVEGIGSSISDASAWTLMQMDSATRDAVLRRTFAPEGGAGQSMVRIHINSCDFSRKTYSCCDTPGDFALKTFNVDYDRECVIPVLKRILAFRPDLKIVASPWSAPAWMKTNGKMCGGGELRRECRAVWAEFFCRFVEEYAKEGIPIWGVTVNNESYYEAKWEAMTWPEYAQRDFVRDHLGPAFARHGLGHVKIMLWDNGRNHVYANAATTYDDAEASKYVWGAAYHWYGENCYDNVRILHDAYPDKGLVMTEGCNGGNNYGDPEWGDADKRDPNGLYLHEGVWEGGERYGRNMIRDFNNWAAGWIDWNLVVDQTGGPRHLPNGCGAPYVYDTAKRELRPQICREYMAHFHDFVRPGAVRLAVTTTRNMPIATAFANPGGSIVVVTQNELGESVEFIYRFRRAGLQTKLTLPPRSIQTLLLDMPR